MEARISEEWNLIWANPMPNARVFLKDNNMKIWIASIDGPRGSPYEGGEFHMLVVFTNEYGKKASPSGYENKYLRNIF